MKEKMNELNERRKDGKKKEWEERKTKNPKKERKTKAQNE